MFKFTKTNIFCFVIAIMFCLAQIFICQISIETEINQEIMDESVLEVMPVIENTGKIDIWQIEIPSISLTANISEGTIQEVLSEYVGHFKVTSRQEGNIGLAARGYFKDLKLLKEGDEIKYKYNQFEKTYEVEKCRIIKATEGEYLEQSEDNMLTLMAYVENQPEYRRCVQAIEKEEILLNKF